MDNSGTLVIVLSRNYSTGLGVIRSLGSAGYTVDLIASTKKSGSSIIPASSKYVRHSVEVLSQKIQGDDGAEIIAEILKYKDKGEQKPVLFPADDFTASIVASNLDKLNDSFLMPTVVGDYPSNLNEAMDKSVQAELAKFVGLYTPQEWIIDLRNEITIPKEMIYPCFVKPLQSISGTKSEMAVVNNSKELKAHLESMKNFYSDRAVIVQEFLRISKEYDISGVCLDQKIIVPAVIEKTRISKHEPGVTMSGRILSIDTLGDAKDKVIELLKRLRYIGMFDMELTLCDGRIYFNEINIRSGGPNYSYQLSGVNLPDIFVKEITGKGHKKCEEQISAFGKTFVYEKVAWEDYIHSYISKGELKDCINNCDFKLLADRNDPAPGKIFYKRIRLSAIKHRILIALGKEQRSQPKKAKSKGVAIVAGQNYCNILTMVRALGKAGYDTEVLRVHRDKPTPLKPLRSMKPESRSKYVTEFNECVVNGDSNTITDKLLSMAGAEKKLLLPTDDYVCCVVDESLNRLKDKFYIPSIHGKEGEIVRLMDKNLQKALAKEFNIPMLQSVLIKSVDGRYDIPEEIKYPCFIKPNVSMKSNKGKMKKCDNKTELKKVLDRYARSKDFEMLVEEYASIKAEYSILGLSTNGGVVSPGALKVVEGGHRQRKGVALTGEIITSPALKEITQKCNEFVKSLGYTGMFDIDLIEADDGSLYFLELNFRAGASTHALTTEGINLPAILADYMLEGKPVDTNCKLYADGKAFVSEKVLIEEYARGDIEKSKMKSCIKNAEIHFIEDYDDVEPYRYFKRLYPIASLMRIAYKITDSIKRQY